MSTIINIANCIKAGIGPNASTATIKSFLQSCVAAAAELKTEYFIDSGVNDLQAAMIIRSSVIDRIDKIDSMTRFALSRGYLLPTSPFAYIEKINASRPITGRFPVQQSEQEIMFKAATQLAEISKKYEAGEITFERQPSSQIASYEVSVDGISTQSGDPLADILGYQPDGDFVKRKRAIESLSKLDFSKRKPYLLFTMESRDGDTVLCWGKMRDASGYSIKRRDVFNNSTSDDVIKTNDALKQSTSDLLKNEMFYQALSFYDWLTPDDVFAIVDESTINDTLYSYSVSGIQKKAPASPFIFDVPMNSLLFSPSLAESVDRIISDEAAKFNQKKESISPYPAISEAVYGDPDYGWIIAGCNILASIRRGDSVDTVRSNSYIGSLVENISSEAKAGRLFVPSNVEQVKKTVEDSISSYGVSQTILSVIDGVGMTAFISGKDDPYGIQATQQSVEGSTSGLARILAAIDPETATLDPKLIVIGKSGSSKILSSQSEVAISAIDEIIEEGTIDLTTYIGIGRLMKLIRAIYDFYPGAFV